VILQERAASGRLWFLKSNLFARTLLNLYWHRMALHGFWTLMEVAVRYRAFHDKGKFT